MASESIAHEAENNLEPIWARGIIVKYLSRILHDQEQPCSQGPLLLIIL